MATSVPTRTIGLALVLLLAGLALAAWATRPVPTSAASAAATDITLQPRWTLVGWTGTSGVSIADALRDNAGADGDLTSKVTVFWSWDSAEQTWGAYFPGQDDTPGANDFTEFTFGTGYWIAINGSQPITWTIPEPGE